MLGIRPQAEFKKVIYVGHMNAVLFKTWSKCTFFRIFFMSLYIVFRYFKTMQTVYFFERGESQLSPGTKILKIR